MTFAGPGHGSRHLVLDVSAKQQVRLHDDAAHAGIQRGRVERIGERRPCGGHEPEANAAGRERLRACGHVRHECGGGELEELARRTWIARTAADHHEPRRRRWHRLEPAHGVTPTAAGEPDDRGMTAECSRLLDDDARGSPARIERFGNVAFGMAGREQDQRRCDRSPAAAGCQGCESVADRWTNHLEKPHLHRHAGQHVRHEPPDGVGLSGPDRIGRAVPDDHHATPGPEAGDDILPRRDRRADAPHDGQARRCGTRRRIRHGRLLPAPARGRSMATTSNVATAAA